MGLFPKRTLPVQGIHKRAGGWSSHLIIHDIKLCIRFPTVSTHTRSTHTINNKGSWLPRNKLITVTLTSGCWRKWSMAGKPNCFSGNFVRRIATPLGCTVVWKKTLSSCIIAKDCNQHCGCGWKATVGIRQISKRCLVLKHTPCSWSPPIEVCVTGSIWKGAHGKPGLTGSKRFRISGDQYLAQGVIINPSVLADTRVQQVL